ncbi:phage tail length tape measure family protein [Rhizobium laguerreae]|uniref:phage tail length tape measure family protein n=1 Tax=Rhizobium laguerreae TaxID=1076926 RepID=UPI001440FA3C|nr:phage tail length tape measure family protein [Rhizobium laguerreae]NKM69161.1 hypothetical protein [Rhizobium laguerreae]
MTVAQLGFAIDSSDAANAASDLDKLTSSAAKAEQAAQRTGAAGSRMSRGFADLNPALDKIVGSLGRLEGITTSIDKRLDAMTSAAGRAARANQVLDKSAIEASTAYKQLEASLNAVTAAQKKGDASLATSLSAIEKQREAIARLNAELQKLRAAPSPTTPGRPRSPANNNGNQGSVGNIASQFFDIGTTAAFMNPATVAIQQGPQLAQAFAGQSTKQALAGLAGGLAAIVSPLSLVAIGLTGAAAAAISYGVSALTASDDTKKLEDAMERHDGIMKRLEDRYGSLIDKVKGYGIESTRMLSIEASSDIRGLRNANKITGEEFFSGIGTQTRGGYVADNSMFGSGFMAFNDAITKLRNEFTAGRPDFEAFYDSIYKTAQTDPAYAKKADELAKLVAQFREGSRALEEMERIQRRLFNDVGPNGMLLSQGPTSRDDMGNLALWQSQQKVAAQRRQQSFDAQVQGVNARSPQERAAAARASAAAQYNGDESVTERRVRIEQAGALALVQAERQLADAQRDRALNLDKTLQDQQQEIDLVGKTGGAAAALRKEYELTSALRMEAARQGIDVDQKELDLIHQRAQALGELTDKYNQSRFNFEMGQQSADARLSPRDRQITTTLRQYGLPEDLGGSNAARLNQQMNWQEAKDAADGFGDAFTRELVSGSHDIGKSFLAGFEAAIANQTTKLWERLFDSLGNAFADWVTGSKGGAASIATDGIVTGAVGGTKSTSAVSKALVSSAGGAVDKAFGMLGANENTDASSINAFLKKGGVDLDSAQSAWCAAFVNSSLEQVGVKGSGSNVANSFLNWGSKIDPSQILRGDVLLENRGLGAGQLGGHVGFATGATRNTGGQQQLQMLSGNSADSVQTSWVNAMDVQARRANDAASSLGRFSTLSNQATQNLGNFSGGLGQFSQQLAAAASGANGPSGWKLGGLFGGISPTSSMWAPNTTLGGFLVNGFASGTDSAPGGVAMVGEKGRELVNLPQGAQVIPNHKTEAMLSGARSAANVNVKFNVANNTGSNVRAERRDTNDGPQFDVIIDEAVAAKLNTPGSRSRRAVKSQFGLSEGLARR